MKSAFKDRPPPSDAEIREYFRILKADPRSRVFAPLAESLIRRGRLEEAEKVCRLGLEANPEFSDGHLAYARVLFYLFRHQEALERVKITLGLDQQNVDAYLIAAEIFISRSQFKAASQACMKAIDIDPGNEEARRLIKRTSLDKAGLPQPVEAIQMSTDSFRASAGTAPSRRLIDNDGKQALTNPFKELLQEAGQGGSDKLDREEQPFSALSAGSHPLPIDTGTDPSAEFDVPTRREKKTAGPDAAGVPRLPDHPPVPGLSGDDDLLALVPGDSDPFEVPTEPKGSRPPPGPRPVLPHAVPAKPAAAAPQTRPATPGAMPPRDLPSIESVQAIIDSYSERMTTDEGLDPVHLKMPRSGRLAVILVVLATATGIAALILLGLQRSERPVAEEKKSPPAPATLAPPPDPATLEPLDIAPLPEDDTADMAPAEADTPPKEPAGDEAAVADPPPAEEAAPEEPAEAEEEKPVVKKPVRPKVKRRKRKLRRKTKRKRRKR